MQTDDDIVRLTARGLFSPTIQRLETRKVILEERTASNVAPKRATTKQLAIEASALGPVSTQASSLTCGIWLSVPLIGGRKTTAEYV